MPGTEHPRQPLQQPPTDRNKVFISYRRSDVETMARLLAERLRATFGNDAVFIDTDSIPPGEPFPERIERELGRARVVLVVMGKDWVGQAEWGCRRIDDSKDWVRIEVKTALAAGNVAVIPVLADGQDRMPPADALPKSLRRLRDIAAVSIRSGTFDRDVGPLVDQLADLGIPRRSVATAAGAVAPATILEEPRYPNRRARELSERLQDLIRRRGLLRMEGVATADLDADIVETRRRLRAGAPEPGWELGDGKYLLLEKLGRGGFATVWKARDMRARDGSAVGGLVAVKVMHAHMAGDPVVVDRFFRGARIMAELQHPGIVRVFESRGEDQGYLYFVMELMEGGTLRQAVRNQKAEHAETLQTILTVGKALAAAHERGYVHRDVKPTNILLGVGQEPKLSDFDLVLAEDTTGGTQTAAMGTYAYSSPECLARPQEAGPTADVYSLGMSLVFALTRADPNPRTIDLDLRRMRCPEPLKELLRRATSIRPEDRFPSASEFVVELQKVLARNPPTSNAPRDLASDTHPPAWAKRLDRDRFGTVAELELAPGVLTRLRWIPPGEFVMGSPSQEAGRLHHEGPQHAVRLTNGYWLGEVPVTQRLWVAVMGTNPSSFKGPEKPVEMVSWEDCHRFLTKINELISGLHARLPTEAEWEYACRAGSETGPAPDGMAWYAEAGEGGSELEHGLDASARPARQRERRLAGTHPVGLKKPNAWGLLDMLGNVYEWCWDWYGPYDEEQVANPTGPTAGEGRVVRGGSWNSSGRCVRATYRDWGAPTFRYESLGFRLAKGE